MSPYLKTWQRFKPSGHVHFIMTRDLADDPVVVSVCGSAKRASRVTADYPPRAQHCPKCAALVEVPR